MRVRGPRDGTFYTLFNFFALSLRDHVNNDTAPIFYGLRRSDPVKKLMQVNRWGKYVVK